MKKNILVLTRAAVLCLSVLTLAACRSNKEDSNTASSSDTSVSTESDSSGTAATAGQSTLTEKEKKALKVIGTKTGDKNEYEIVVENYTGTTIEKMAVKNITDSDFEGDLLEKTTPFTHKEQGLLYFTPTSEETTDTSEDPDGWAVTEGYDLSFTVESGQEYVVHSFPFEDAQEVTLFIEKDTAYLEYVSTASGESINTLEMEKAILESSVNG
ncbi:hypothetical protein [Enterococcus larvae]|uniref:hypothetical protein n=1 Tax=Enterococcus larvae TaxID=2794352 RepID=UPI003F366979